MRMNARGLTLGTALAVVLSACTNPSLQSANSEAVEAPEAVAAEAASDPVADLLSRMSVERKVAQLIMPDISAITPADVEEYRFGTVLNGGNSGPNNNDFAPAPEWLTLADAYWDASVKPLSNGEPAIPVLWGTDAVHGHANVIGATVFPHNIGLGATGDADLIRRIGAATAIEIEATGIEWTFAPTVAVARDDRWGRTYESYSEDPELVSKLGVAMIEGLQGRPGDANYLREGKGAATAKHFFGDGGTEQGVDQGDVNGDLAELMAIHAAPYPAAIDAGVASVMASFNSINGSKMHGNEPLLNGELRGNLGFGGLTVGDWNGHGQIKGCTNSDCAQALLAGLDVYMVPEDWKALYETLLVQIADGTVPMARLDEAVTRVLRLKEQLGMFGAEVRPSERVNAGKWDLLGHADHRAVAREAVAKSLVILKNDGILPIKEGANIVVAGTAADNIPQQAGGWSVTWQGGGELTAKDFPGATSIYQGIAAAAEASGGNVTLSVDGELGDGEKPDAAIVVFGEKPYAEFVGDRKDMVFRDEEGLELLKAYREAGIKTVAVFLSGRPMWMNRELNAADAFVAAWLPGSEGAGVSDVLYGAQDATGRLSFTWPSACEGNPINGPEGALFPFGFGLSYGEANEFATLDETCDVLTSGGSADWFTAGRLAARVKALSKGTELPDLRGRAGGIVATGIDRDAQEDARQITFGPQTAIDLSGPQGGNAYRIEYLVNQRPAGPVVLQSGGSSLDISQELLVAEGKGWREMIVTQQCLAGLNNALTIASEAPFAIQVSSIAREDAAEGMECSF